MPAFQTISQTAQAKGPSGFIELGGQLLVVDYGRIYIDGNQVGFLFDDGTLEQNSILLGRRVKTIDEIDGCIFRGIDTEGQELQLPSHTKGPTGSLSYNNVPLHVVNGRLATAEHQVIGNFDDQGAIVLNDPLHKRTYSLDETSQLSTVFKGSASNGQDWSYDFSRPLYRKNKSYWENEIIRYFENYDKLSMPQKNYVLKNLELWSRLGLVQIVRKSEGTAAIGNVRHGTAGVTGVRTGYVTFDKEEFEREVEQFKQFGALSVVATRLNSFVEVRSNQVVAHEYGHQLEFVLSQAAQEEIHELYNKKADASNKIFPSPRGYEGSSEIIPPDKLEKRLFVSGYSRSSFHEYFAEGVSTFSVKESREVLKQVDPELHAFLLKLVSHPEQVVRTVLVDTVLALQASLRLGNELNNEEFL
jgi:hypothetical protein